MFIVLIVLVSFSLYYMPQVLAAARKLSSTFLLGVDDVADLRASAVNLSLKVLNGRARLDECMQ